MMNWSNHIVADPNIMFGKPVIKGTRIPVDLILEKMSLGTGNKTILEGYPDLSENDLLACLAYASSLIRNEINLPLAS